MAVMIILFIYSELVSAQMPADINSQKAAPVDKLVEGLKSKLDQNPSDMEGWILLGKSYHYLGRFQDAEEAFTRARKLGYQGELPDAKKANHTPLTLRVGPTGNDWLAKYVDSEIAEKKESAQQVAVISQLQIHIDIDENLKEELNKNAIVYIFAREENKTGPPLAVRKVTVNDLPIDLQLDDSNAIIPSHKISLATNIIAGARISLSGSANRAIGDYEALSGSLTKETAQQLKLYLDKTSIIRKGE
jgi:cytochrome c-type biogenesis protein CcmH